VWAVGEWIGWDGSLLATMAGTLGGACISALVGAGLMAASQSIIPAVVVIGLGVPTSAAFVYHGSAAWPTGSNALLAPTATTFNRIDLKF